MDIFIYFFENYIGIDTDESRIKTALEYFPKKSFQKVDLITKSNQYLPFQNNTFDIILFNDCVHHISNYNMKFILLEINRILKKNGIIIIREPKKDTSLFTYLITEIFENGNYVRTKNEYKEIFNSFTPIYEISNFEYIRDYYVLVVKKSNNICLNNINIVDTHNYQRIIINYFIILISLYNIYFLFNNILQ
jgi:ubiquinone/menaquinone biosynthesis C-methylase UbiE